MAVRRRARRALRERRKVAGYSALLAGLGTIAGWVNNTAIRIILLAVIVTLVFRMGVNGGGYTHFECHTLPHL